MEVFSLSSPPAPPRSMTGLPAISWRRAAPFSAQLFTAPRRSWSRFDAGSICSLQFQSRPNASGPTQCAISASNTATEVNKAETSLQDKNVAFVAGATGRVGSRLVRELLKLGFRVRAGVRSAKKAEALVESVRQKKIDQAAGAGAQSLEKLEIVECDLENEGNIGPAIANASTILCCIGASEKEVFDVTGPYRIDYKATENLIKAATMAKVDHFILLTSLGTNKIGFPASILNLFWGVLCWKRKAEEALIASGLPYTIVRPGGMERPTDSYKETHNIILANEDTYFGGQVSNLQVAELMAFMSKNRKLSYCKVVEVIAETTAPLLPMEELLAKIPSQREVPAVLKDPAPANIEIKSVEKKDPGKTDVQKLRPLSPYTMYDALKPPSSPTPTPSTTPENKKEKHVDLVQAKSGPESPSTVVSSSRTKELVPEKETAQALTQNERPLSPYTAYADLKPPTSPMPSSPKY